ncbi:DUF6352 family protein [Phyllobacterium endophyticum]|uniref:DUF6352 family protein n=1 Tax=Phyllobacterium endophyticum TaxID=1149773 RepID=UPI0011C924B6|nr:DUF6352 family protein [Phyllobacterium endophyticum]TXR47008.1 hypothetical protein FVA77_22080 [Phyllobacterium endophyticum]
MNAFPDFWLSSGHHLLDRNDDGRLCVTGDFLKAYLARPELVPPEEACSKERELHGALLEDPWRAVTAAEIARIQDADARENWGVMIGWRDHLAGFDTIEAAYLDIARRPHTFPQMFIGHLVQTILRNVLNECEDVFVLRAAEMFFRPQRITVEDGNVLATDLEVAERHGDRHESPLLAWLGLPTTSGVDVISESSSTRYWSRSDHFDMALNLTPGQQGLAALGKVIARWVSHLLGVEVTVEPLAELQEAVLTWYVGLDSGATRLADALWNNEEIDETLQGKLISLYRLRFLDPADVIEKTRGEPVYLMLAMGDDEIIRLKPQNLVTGLPLSQSEKVN